jgi:7-cyano-7-deazaguanine synthase
LKHRAVLLFSGGFDSTLAAVLLRQRRVPTIALTINYGSRPEAEKTVARRLAAQLGFNEHVELPLALKDNRNEPDKWPSTRHEAWFPYRNVIFFGIAAHYAVTQGCNVIAAGIRVWDGPDFDDATRPYLEGLGTLLQMSGSAQHSNRLAFFLPLLDSHAEAEAALASRGEATAVLRDSWSCWRNGPDPCGQCAPCRFRDQFFQKVEASLGQHPVRRGV